jgi:delta24-sterol reductase
MTVPVRKVTKLLRAALWQVGDLAKRSLRSKTRRAEDHRRAVDAILAAMRRRPSEMPVTSNRRDTDSHCTRRALYKRRAWQLPLRELTHVLEVDRNRRTALVEAGCTMEDLVAVTLKEGLMPCVVPEFRRITAGGAIQGLGVESSSHYFGIFENSCNYYDVILGNGELVRASPAQNSDLFFGLCGSFGSLGYITAVELQLIRAPAWFHITYEPFENWQEACERLAGCVQAAGPDEAIEMIVYGFREAVLIRARHCHSMPAGTRARSFRRSWSPWFYRHAREQAHRGGEDLIPPEDYLFRHDRGAFWLASTKMSHHWLSRLLFGWLAHQHVHHVLGRMEKESVKEKKRVIQDIGIPLSRLAEALEFCNRTLDLYPLWCLPVRHLPESRKIFSGDVLPLNETYIVDLGIYGVPGIPLDDPVAVNRQINDFADRLGTGKALFAVPYYTAQEFWSRVDQQRYERLRSKYHAEGVFLDIFEKISAVE